MTPSVDLVRDFCAAFTRRDTEELLRFFADDAVYHNMPMAPVQGTEAIKRVLQMFLSPAESVEFAVLHVADEGNVVLTERLDCGASDRRGFRGEGRQDRRLAGLLRHGDLDPPDHRAIGRHAGAHAGLRLLRRRGAVQAARPPVR